MNRLFEITLLLSKQKIMTAKELAEHFEVSKRTILRDIDKLLVAGIPIQSKQGYQGGISIDKDYEYSLNVLNIDEKDTMVAGIQAMNSIQEQSTTKILQKLFQHEESSSIYDIDLSSWYGNTLTIKLEVIKQAILQEKKLTFTYYAKNNYDIKIISPTHLVFRWSSWYVRGVCENSKTYKLYKVNRMEDIRQLNEPIIKKEYIPEDEYYTESKYHLIAHFDKLMKSRLVDAYGIHSFKEEDGYLYFENDFETKEYLITWILGFGSYVEVIEPKEIREELIKHSEEMNELYKHDK